MTRVDDSKIIQLSWDKASHDIARLMHNLTDQSPVMQATINDAADKALDSLDALKGQIRAVKVKQGRR